MADYELIVCGTGFASSFFLYEFLRSRPNARVLVLERGREDSHSWQLENRRQSSIESGKLFKSSGLRDKEWLFTVGLGGGSNCWWGQTPRMLPEDFELQSRYGVGADWAVSYGELEEYYDQAENLMAISGPQATPYPKSRPYPQPAHRLASFDRRMVEEVGDLWIPAPCARSSLGTQARGSCCGNGVCGICPVDAKFRVMNELAHLYRTAKSVTLQLNARVKHLDIQNGVAKGVTWSDSSGQDIYARADLVVFGMNALFNASILLDSGDDSPNLGKNLNEQVSRKLYADLTDIDNFDGGTHISGLGYMYYGGGHRKKHAAAVIEHYNAPAALRSEPGKWRKRAVFKIVAENIPEPENYVSGGDVPTAHFEKHSDYGLRGLDEACRQFERVLQRVGVQNVAIGDVELTEGHIMGTTIMSRSALTGVVDGGLIHHRIRNLVVAGSGAFPTSPPANPSLTISALSLRAARSLTQ